MNNSITITAPDDWHVHFRDGSLMSYVVPFTARQFSRALVMPNLTPPIKTVEQAVQYRKRILGKLQPEIRDQFDPKMSLYLTDETPIKEIRAVARNAHILGFKLYPAGATTNSISGVTKITALMPFFEEMAKQDVVLQIHGEVTDAQVDIFDKEAEFVEQVLRLIHNEIPDLRMVLEHVTTQEGVEFVRQGNANMVATITPQHMMYNRNALFHGGLRPHYYCLPVLKREKHRDAVSQAAISGNPSFFLGTDSAPHLDNAKINSCGCAGIFSAPAALEIYASIFNDLNALDKLQGFASYYGADFYKLPRNQGTVTLYRASHTMDDSLQIDGQCITPLCAGERLHWKFRND